MSFTHRARQINPRLGIYFGIFASLFAALVLLILIFEQLGTSSALLRSAMLVGPLVLLAAVGVASSTSEPLDYFAAGRRVPSVYCGLGLAITAMGATGFVTMTGAIFFIGFDALCIINAGLAGFVVMAILLAPFFRKFGTFTIPTYLGRRFGSYILRVTAAALLAVPTLLMLVAELQVGFNAAQWLTGQSEIVLVPVLVCVVLAGIVFGGVRALTWTNVAAGIVLLAALVVPVAVVAVTLGYLPIPQLSHGPVLRGVGRFEAVQAFPVVLQSSLGFDLPSDGFHSVSKRFSEPFGSIGQGAFVLATMTIFTGVAAAPWLLPRVATAPGVYEARKSLGWATFFFAIGMLTAASIAVFMRYLVLEVAGTKASSPPSWLQDLVSYGLAQVTPSGETLTTASIALDRDSILMSLPIAAGLPMAVVYFSVAGILAAAIATAGATATALANLLSEDIVNGLSWKPAHGGVRLMTSRLLTVLTVAFAGVVVMITPSDPLKLLLWALALTGSTAFPVLIASIWWKRANKFGAFSSLVIGFSIAVLVIVAGEAGWVELDGVLAGAIALPLATFALIVVSLATLPPSRQVLELLRDIRIPGGEILYDREIRLIKLKEQTQTRSGKVPPAK